MNSQSTDRNQQFKTYIEQLFCPEDETLRFVRAHSQQANLPPIQVPPAVGKMLYLLAKIQEARYILEIGTLGGYSTVWLARALPPHGKLISLESNPKHVELARLHIEEAGLTRSVEVLWGDAAELLNQLNPQQTGPFDLIFIDADKPRNRMYLDLSLRLSRPGTLIIIDNLIPKGEQAIGQPCHDEAVAIYQFNQYIAQHPALETLLVPTLVGDQGRLDALGLARVKSNN